MWYWGSGPHWWGWLLGFFGMVVFWGLLIWAIFAIAHALLGRSTSERREEDPKRILDQRLARGEITPEEYQRTRDAIDGRPSEPRARSEA